MIDDIVELAKNAMMNPDLADGPHGTGHWRRTAALALLIKQEILSPADDRLLEAAAVLHDIGRINEEADPLHGLRGLKSAAHILSCIMPGFKRLECGKILDIVAHHCDPGFGTYIEMRIVMDADKLDRLRFGDDKLDIDRLAFPNTCTKLLPEVYRLLEEIK